MPDNEIGSMALDRSLAEIEAYQENNYRRQAAYTQALAETLIQIPVPHIDGAISRAARSTPSSGELFEDGADRNPATEVRQEAINIRRACRVVHRTDPMVIPDDTPNEVPMWTDSVPTCNCLACESVAPRPRRHHSSCHCIACRPESDPIEAAIPTPQPPDITDTTVYQCQGCHSNITGDDIAYISRGQTARRWCRECTFRCWSCAATFPHYRAGSPTIDGRRWCDDCQAEREAANRSSCPDCDEDYTCEDCEEDSYFDEDIQEYDYTPYWRYQGRKGPHFGIELEVEYTGNVRELPAVKRSLENVDWIFMKNDGSLEYGVEFVTHPLNWGFIQKSQGKIDELLKTCIDAGWRSYNTGTCGIHIHVSRKDLGSLQLYKILKLVYDEPAMTLLISQRLQRHLNSWAAISGESDESLARKAKRKFGNASGGRYVAVNLEPSNTIEFRFFRGTLNMSSFMKNLEYVKALVDFTRNVKIRDCDGPRLMEFVDANKKDYPNLHPFLVTKGLIKCVLPSTTHNQQQP